MLRPKPLAHGDAVALLAPSSPVPEDVLDRAVDSIHFLGLTPVIFPSCKMRHGYLSGLDADRAKDIHTAFADLHIKGIFCLRGGYGATRLLPLLDYRMIAKNPKIFVGYSDITALHTAFNQRCAFITFHGPMPNTGYAQMDAFSLRSLQNEIFCDSPLRELCNPPGEKLTTLLPGTVKGILTGGNLSLLAGTLGSPYEIDTRGKILFLEEVGERPYRLDRSLTALALAGKFRDAAGVILGTFADCEEPEKKDADPGAISEHTLSLIEIFEEVVLPAGKPTSLNLRAGHIYPQSTLPMGAYFSTCFPCA